MMLVLSRKTNQRIKIGDNVFVQVVELRGSFVRLGITAPDDVHILREELLEIPELLRQSEVSDGEG